MAKPKIPLTVKTNSTTMQIAPVESPLPDRRDDSEKRRPPPGVIPITPELLMAMVEAELRKDREQAWQEAEGGD